MNPNNKTSKRNKLGQKHIRMVKYYEVRIDNKSHGRYATLDEAIKKRDEILDGKK